MVRYVFLALVCGLCLGSAVDADDDISAARLAELKGATVLIQVQRFVSLDFGSGFLIHVDGETGYIVTNSHVVDTRNRNSVRRCRSRFIAAQPTKGPCRPSAY